MFKFFGRNKVTINSISVPDLGWKLEKENDHIKQWINPEQTMALTLNFIDLKPDIPSIKNVDLLRNYYRKLIAQNNGGLVLVDILNIKGYEAIKTIFKIPQEPTGMTYLSSLTIGFQKLSFVVKVQAAELGTTGIRDTVIATKLQQENKISIDDNGYAGWFRDPYNPEFKEGILMNKSEEEIYDSMFPEHPLSKARKLIEQIEQGIEFGNELEKAKRINK